jgi:hypothetical protein
LAAWRRRRLPLAALAGDIAEEFRKSSHTGAGCRRQVWASLGIPWASWAAPRIAQNRTVVCQGAAGTNTKQPWHSRARRRGKEQSRFIESADGPRFAERLAFCLFSLPSLVHPPHHLPPNADHNSARIRGIQSLQSLVHSLAGYFPLLYTRSGAP